MGKIEKIRKEIERLKDENRKIKCEANERYCSGYDDAFYDLVPFLNTLESEKPIPNDLEEAAMNYIAPIENEDGLRVINFSGQDIKDAFITGAKWQYQKDRGEFAKIKAKTWSEGFDACKEQMMKEAVICEYDQYPAAIYLPAPLPRMNRGDKVRIIIIKEN